MSVNTASQAWTSWMYCCAVPSVPAARVLMVLSAVLMVLTDVWMESTVELS